MLTIIPHLSEPLVQLLYKSVRPLLSVDAALSLQKRAYSVLNTLLTTHKELMQRFESRLEIVHLVNESLLTCHVSCRNMRLRCLVVLMESMEGKGEELSAAATLVLGEVRHTVYTIHYTLQVYRTNLFETPSLMNKSCAVILSYAAKVASSLSISIMANNMPAMVIRSATGSLSNSAKLAFT